MHLLKPAHCDPADQVAMPTTVPATDPFRCMSQIVLPRRQHHRCSGWRYAGQPHPRVVTSWNDYLRQRRCQIACHASSVSTQSKVAGSQQGDGAVAQATVVAVVPAGDTSPLGPPWQVFTRLLLVLDVLPCRAPELV